MQQIVNADEHAAYLKWLDAQPADFDEYAGNSAWCAGRDWRALAAEATERRLVEENELLRRELTIAEGVESNLVDDNDRLRAALAAAQAGTVVKEDFRPNEWPGSGSAPWPTLQEAGADDR